MQYIQFQTQLSSDVPTASQGAVNFFVDSSDSTLKIKNDSGSTITTSGGVTDVTYSELKEKILSSSLVAGSFYKITDFRTCYDQPDFDIYGDPVISETTYKQGPIEPIIIFALSTNSISIDAYQPEYPKDKIKYDYTFDSTEITNGDSFGRITERIDEFNNRTDYDHRNILFKRYRSYSFRKTNKYNGTIEVLSDGEVIGNDTSFENDLTIGSVIAIPDMSNTFFEVLSIDSNTEMTITGLSMSTISSGTPFYITENDGIISPKRNNISLTDYEDFYTFDLSNELIINNYIGDYTIRHLNDELGYFMLANNVFIGGEYSNNIFGNVCYNNTFDDDCTNNKIGDYFRGNITNDDFDNNIIGNYFRNNYITANFNRNQIGNYFGDNYIVNDSFYRNEIGEYFEENRIYDYQFQNNDIGNNFRDNEVYYDFYNNFILNGYNNNNIKQGFYHNKISGGFNYNTINVSFYENEVGHNFYGNTIGDLNIPGEFYRNKIGNQFGNNNTTGYTFSNVIGNDFNSNSIQTYFATNIIHNNFYNNVISSDFGFGGGTSRSNFIMDNFYNNNIGEYFYDNTIVSNFNNNIILDDFRYNTVKSEVYDIDFTSSTFVYGDYNTEIFKNSTGDYKLSLYSGDTLTIVNIND